MARSLDIRCLLRRIKFTKRVRRQHVISSFVKRFRQFADWSDVCALFQAPPIFTTWTMCERCVFFFVLLKTLHTLH